MESYSESYEGYIPGYWDVRVVAAGAVDSDGTYRTYQEVLDFADTFSDETDIPIEISAIWHEHDESDEGEDFCGDFAGSERKWTFGPSWDDYLKKG